MTELLLRLFVKERDSVKGRSAVGRLSGAVGIAGNVLLFLGKLLVGTLAGSVSIAADAMNNLSDAASSVVTLVGFKLAEKPADEDHPYGHARFEYLSGLAVAALILLIGFELAKTSVGKILVPEKVTLSLPVVLVLVGSIVIKLWLSSFNRKLGKKISSTALFATAADSRNDAIATTAVLLAALVEAFSGWQSDGFIGLGVAVFILFSGMNMAKETISPLLGEAASPELRKLIVSLVEKEEKVLGFHDLMVHDYGPGQRFASLHVEMDAKEDPLLCHEIIDNLERGCMEKYNVHLVIHYDPVVVGDPEAERVRELVTKILHAFDSRLSIHDFRMVQSGGHTNLIFDIAVPSALYSKRREIKQHLDEALARTEETTYYTAITFDQAAFN